MPNKINEIWTALPNGFARDRSLWRLSLLVTFRLTTDTTPPPKNLMLADFIERVWVDNNWAKTVSNYKFKVDFGKGPVPVETPKNLHYEMWDALFGNPRDIKVNAFKELVKGELSGAEILTYKSRELSERLDRGYTLLANTKQRFRTTDRRQMALVAAARSEISSLVDEINIYAPADPTEDDRLKVLNAVQWLDEDTATNPKALAYRDLYLDRISRNGGRDLRLTTVRDVHQKIKDKVPGIKGPDGQSGPGPIVLRRAQPQESPQPSAAGTAPAVSPEFAIFHSPPDSASMHAAAMTNTREFDFHEMLTMVGSHPLLMRQLGLVIDVEVDPGAIADDGTGFVRVTHAGPGEPQLTAHPKTAYTWNRGRRIFLPQSNTPRIKEGLLDLSDDKIFYIQTADSDGALMKHLAHASNSRRENPDGPKNVFQNVVEEDLEPTLRTQGISVLFKDIDEFLRQLLAAAEEKSCQPTDCEFHAEDLIKGLRVDIQEVDSRDPNEIAGNWYSLCERNEKYYFFTADNRPLFEWPASGTQPSEGIVGLTVTKPEVKQTVQAANLKVLQQHQSLFRWENWSLCVDFPQKRLDAKSRNKINPENAPLLLRPEFTVVDRSLPKLRFGKKYRVRCRVVDPAGNSLRHNDVGAQVLATTIGPDRFARYEAIAPPVLLVTGAINPVKTPGDQLNRLVLRDGSGASQRCVVPPRVTTMTAIIAGAYDSGVSRDASAFEGAILEEKGEFPQVDHEDPAYDLPIFRYLPANAEPPKQPYLPDPFTVAACLAMSTPDDKPIFADTAENELICGYFHVNVSWPNAQPFLISLVPAALNSAPIARLVRKSPNRPFVTAAEVSLTPGEIIKLKLSSGIVEGDLEKMAFHKLAQLNGVKLSRELEHQIICGGYPLYTPAIDVTLVHAIKKPLDPVKLSLVPTPRKPGDTALDLDIALRLHRNSTGKIECEAKWSEPVDDVSQPFCSTKHSGAVVADEKIKLIDESNPDPTPHLQFKPQYKIKGLQNFNDTKHRRVTYSMRATTRFREYYPPAPAPNTPEQDAAIQQKERDTYSTEFGAEEVKVVSTARPPVPNLAYVIPTFRWDQSVTKKVGSDSRRWGGGLRIYLERPWFASGEGERLAIVLYPGTLSGPLCKFMAPHITQWGRDPIWGLKPPAGNFPERKLNPFPGRNDFRWRGAEPHYQPGLMLEAFEKVNPASVGCTSGEELQVAALAFEPVLDEERGLWRCDIEMNPGTAYFPFVRLALARYQHHSLVVKETDCRISSVVQAEFMQLTPDRWATLRYESDRVVNVTITGFSYQSRRAVTEGGPIPGTGVMRVAVEERCKNREGSLRWQRLEQKDLPDNPGVEPGGQLNPSSVTSNQNGETIWNFRLTLPHSRKTSRYRVAILESETIAQDKGIGHLEYKDSSRIVYADILGV